MGKGTQWCQDFQTAGADPGGRKGPCYRQKGRCVLDVAPVTGACLAPACLPRLMSQMHAPGERDYTHPRPKAQAAQGDGRPRSL